MKKLLVAIISYFAVLCSYIFKYNDNVNDSLFMRLKKVFYNAWISRTFKKIGDNSIISPFAKLIGGKYIEIGNNSSFGKSAVITAWDSYLDDKFTPTIIFGNNVCIGEYCHITAINKIIVGNGVLTGRWLTITDNAHGEITSSSFTSSPINRRLYSPGAVIIKDNVWIGDKVTILANVCIGKNAVIGANSVVTTDVPDGAVVAGAPAKVIKVVI